MKPETGPGGYRLSALIDSTVSAVRMRLTGKPIRLYTNIMADLPGGLAGDEALMRQILLGLLSDAVTNTVKGSIGLSITAEGRDKETVLLRIAVSSPGPGIRTEEGQKISQETELAIAEELCRSMGGSITVESRPGKGVTVTALVPQGIHSPEPFAAVDEPEHKQTLLYEGRRAYAESVCWSLDQLGVPYTLVTNVVSFATALYRWEWRFVLSGYGLYEQIKPLMEREEAFVGGKRPPLALMAEWGTPAHIPGVPLVSLPAQSRSIADILDGKPVQDRADAAGSGGAGFVIPGVDIAKGIALTGGTEAGYRQVLAVFRRDAEERLALLRSFAEQNYRLEPDSLPLFTTQVHALKSAAGSLGAVEVSQAAARLEAAGKAADLPAITEALPVFAQRLAALVEGIGAVLDITGERAPDTPGEALSGDNSALSPGVKALFGELAAALEAQKAEDIDRLLEELGGEETGPGIRALIDHISDDVLMAEYGAALESVKKVTQGDL